MPTPDRQIELICGAVAAQTGRDAAALRKRRRGGMAKETRVAMFVCRELMGLEPREIGAAFGAGRVDALRAMFRSDWQKKEDDAFAALVEAVTARVKAASLDPCSRPV